ncbi:TPA: IS21 family transposase, partial [Candidatus Bipolaricaulota bacterium]|nr:IS21 family transposase [Candidatus Bipolaricaulota bacterium]
MVKLEEWMNILQLHKQGLSISEIARRTGRDRKTIRKYLQQPWRPPQRKPAKRKSKLDPFKDYLLKRWDEGVTNAVKLLDEIKNQGYQGGYTILKDFLHPLRQEAKNQAVLRFETAPGLQAQVDWACFGKILVDGEWKRLYAFTMTLGYSRMKYLEFMTSVDIEHFLQGHINAFHYFGGVPEEVLVDNLKSAVLWRNGSEIHWNPRYLDFAAHYGFVPRACWPYRAQTKGKVESSIGYVRKNFWPGRHYRGLVDLNRQAREWLDGTANAKVNATTGEAPWERLEREREELMPLEGIADYDTSYLAQRKVTRDCYVHYRGNRYSVPYRYSRREVVVREPVEGEGRQIRIYYQEELIATHHLSRGKGKAICDPAHFAGLELELRKRRDGK